MSIQQDFEFSGKKVKAQDIFSHFQPIVSLDTHITDGFEILSRIKNKQGQDTCPDFLREAFEKPHTGNGLTMHMLKQACLFFDQARENIPEKNIPFVSVNFGPEFLSQNNALTPVIDLLEKHNLSAENIKIEILETAFPQDEKMFQNILKNLKTFRAKGFQILLDDFGEGDSNIERYKKLKDLVTGVKIDKSILGNIFLESNKENTDNQLKEIYEHFTEDNDVQIIVEGIEDPLHLAAANLLGADLGQGFIYSKPLPPAEAITYYVRSQTMQGHPLPHHMQNQGNKTEPSQISSLE